MSLTCGNCRRDVTALDKNRGWCPACNEERIAQATEDAKVATAVQRAYQRGRNDGIALAHAEEAARWRAKIEALRTEVESEADRLMVLGDDVSATRLRALLDGER